MTRIRVLSDWVGLGSGGNVIEAGEYEMDSPYLYGQGGYLLTTGHAELLPEPEPSTEPLVVDDPTDESVPPTEPVTPDAIPPTEPEATPKAEAPAEPAQPVTDEAIAETPATRRGKNK